MTIFVKKLYDTSVIPIKATPESAGYDLSSIDSCVIPPFEKCAIRTGIAISMPPGYYGRVSSRSGLSIRHSLEVGAGVIDSDYRGEIRVILFNFSNTEYFVKIGDRIAQLIIEKIIDPDLVFQLDTETSMKEWNRSTSRGVSGFGSTGF